MTRVCVFAGSSSGALPDYQRAAKELGSAVAARGLKLVYGGARLGLMRTVADAALASQGHVTGVIPELLVDKEMAHRGLSDLRIVTSMHERKALMSDLADGFIALPGGLGTLEELFEALTWAQLGVHHKPCGLLNVHGYFDRLLSFVEHSIDQGFVRRENRSLILASSSANGLLDMMEAYQPVVVEKWLDTAAT